MGHTEIECEVIDWIQLVQDIFLTKQQIFQFNNIQEIYWSLYCDAGCKAEGYTPAGRSGIKSYGI